MSRVARIPLFCFWFLLLLNLVSNGMVLYLRHTAVVVGGVVGLSVLLSVVEMLIVRVVSARFARCGRVLLWLFTAVYVALTVTDAFLIFNFSKIIDQQAVSLVFSTGSAEASTFFGSYLPWLHIAGYAVLAAAVVALAYFGARALSSLPRRAAWLIAAAGSAVGVGYATYMCYGFVRYRNGAEIPTYTSVTRAGYGYMKMLLERRKNAHLLAVCQRAEASATNPPLYDVVMILGESYNRSHTPLYGYDKATTPHMSAMAADSSLVVYTDVVTPEDWTEKVLKGLLGMGPDVENYDSYAIFPVLLHKAGYYTALYDNEFLVGTGDHFHADGDLSALTYDFRNSRQYKYDHEMVGTIELASRPGFYFVHLYGQHFTYADRYPAGWDRFGPDDYDAGRYNARQRDVLAAYDNATLYNDHVVNEVISRFAGRPAVVVYVSDHGEEVFDCRDYFGHGNAVSAPDMSPQLRVPMVVWMSPEFMAAQPEKAAAIRAAASLPLTLNDLGHYMLDLANVGSPQFDATRSALSGAYDASRPRIVLSSIDFDAPR